MDGDLFARQAGHLRGDVLRHLDASISHACPSDAIKYKRKDGKADEAAPPLNLIAVREAGPYAVRGTSGTGRVVARLTQARQCRCGGSSTKPFGDGTHARIGFRSE